MKAQWTVAYLASGLLIAGIALAACSGGGVNGGGGMGPNGISGGTLSQQGQEMGRDTAQSMPAIAPLTFRLTVSPGAKACLPKAFANVILSSPNRNEENLRITAQNLPASTDFDVFIIQVPNKPFGLSWYQGDLTTNSVGVGTVEFLGRFSIETFIVAPGVAPAPVVFRNAFPDVSSNPKTGPVHEYHIGVWFNRPADAVKAKCPGTVTPFNGTHNAGIQALNSGTFPDLAGPLRGFHP